MKKKAIRGYCRNCRDQNKKLLWGGYCKECDELELQGVFDYESQIEGK